VTIVAALLMASHGTRARDPAPV